MSKKKKIERPRSRQDVYDLTESARLAFGVEFDPDDPRNEIFLHQSVPHYPITDPEEQLMTKELREDLSRILSSLPPQQERVIRARFGLSAMLSPDGETLKAISRKIGGNSERIRQIEIKAMRTLKHPSRTKILERHF